MWISTLGKMFVYYWPKVVAAIYFACMNTWVMKRVSKSNANVIRSIIAFFFVSSAFLSIPGELLSSTLYNRFIASINYDDANKVIYVIWSILFDFVIIYLGLFFYAKYTKLDIHLSATSYLEYACIERLCMVLAVSPLSYLIIFIIFQFIAFMINNKDIEFMSQTKTINWKRLSFHLFGLLFILDGLYAAYYVFPNIGTNTIDFPSIWIDALALIITNFIIGILRLSISEGKLDADKIEYMQKFADGQEHIIQTFAELSEAKSGETGQHVKRVAEYCKAIALHMGIDEQKTEYFRIAAMMHDVGKLLIPKDIIEKPDKLTPEEFEIVKAHTVYGDELLSKSEGNIISIARVVAHQHHERWDGKGYPQGLAGDQIDLFAQITSVADVYDALSSKRAYKDAWKAKEAFDEIIKNKGTQFSPAVVDAFSAVYDKIEEVRIRYQD